jgi:hypothetical protein
MKMYNYYFLLLITVFVACTPKVTNNIINTNVKELSQNETIHIFDFDEDVPDNAIFIGNIKVNGRGIEENCTYEIVCNKARQAAKKSNANIVKLTKIKSPNLIRACYKIEADLYQMDTIIQFSSLPDTADYALIHFVRPDAFFAALVNFNITDDQGNMIVRLKNNSKFTHKVTSFGMKKFWTPKVGDTSIEINVVKGQEYYVNCKRVPTYFENDRVMDLIRNKAGKKLFDSVKKTQ